MCCPVTRCPDSQSAAVALCPYVHVDDFVRCLAFATDNCPKGLDILYLAKFQKSKVVTYCGHRDTRFGGALVSGPPWDRKAAARPRVCSGMLLCSLWDREYRLSRPSASLAWKRAVYLWKIVSEAPKTAAVFLILISSCSMWRTSA